MSMINKDLSELNCNSNWARFAFFRLWWAAAPWAAVAGFGRVLAKF